MAWKRPGVRFPIAPPVTLPNFVVIGAAKSATSSLFAYLEGHPEVFMPASKELQYFNAPFPDEPKLRSQLHLGQDWYEARFEPGAHARAIGEASTHYTLHPLSEGTAERMVAVIPEAKLIYLMRHPVERAISHYKHWTGTGLETRPAEVALRNRKIFVDTGRYATQIEQFLPHFPRERILLLTTDELRDRRNETLRRVFEFLDVDAEWVPPVVDQHFNRTQDRRAPRPLLTMLRRLPGRHAVARAVPEGLRSSLTRGLLTTPAVDPRAGEISSELRAELEATFAPEVARLRTYMGPDFDGWGLA